MEKVKRIVRYKKGITGYLFYYSIGGLGYVDIYPSKKEFLKGKGWDNKDIWQIKFEKINE